MRATATDVLVDQAAHGGWLEQPDLRHAIRVQPLMRQAAERTAQPGAKRHAEALLAPVEDPARQQWPQRLLQDVFQSEPVYLEVHGDAAGEFDHRVVEEG